MYYETKIDSSGKSYIETALTDYALVGSSILNKGMGFSQAERDAFNLHGIIPVSESTLEEQSRRSYEAFKNKSSDLDKYLYLRDLQDSNETLFYHLLMLHVEEMMPIVYTPVVGLGCQRFSHIYRRPRGIFLSYPHRDQMNNILNNPRFDYVEAIVVTDGERILGLGDQGAGGMGIPIGKLALYCGLAGIHPIATLPITLDVGTNNPDLINDPLYIGWKHERVRGNDYDDFIDQFVQAIKKRFPKVLLQWEDFAQQNASRILEKYRHDLCTFNDDIQGTAAIATGTLLAAANVTGVRLRDMKVAVAGGGSAGCGISNLIMHALMEDGLSEKEARSRFYIVDRNGLLVEGMQGLLPFQKPFMQPKSAVASWKLSSPSEITLKDVVFNVHPHLLIGVSGQPNIFTEEIVREMAKHTKRPVIFPLSNPTDRSEATPSDLLKWTNDAVVMGTGSPFPDIIRDGKSFRVDQTNNAYIFPGIGLGLIAVNAKFVTDKMFMLAAQALANGSPSKKDPNANLLPSFKHIRDVSFDVAFAVAKEAVATGLAAKYSDDELEKRIRAKMWIPAYLPYKKK
ncbi:MAG TPA: NAD-dependent malic enzyme [Coxiellaceae bacterium]|nr:MAG: NAD-dependent malic enzyme [Gammaproteobacteria bacterium RIFCSPHIGHO2_12_FULL_36_30]HLB56047.1 NAD-dependent malic enzyme [Coxiellaceae bacterium]